MEPRTDEQPFDTRWAVAPALLATLAGCLASVDAVLDGAALTAARIVLVLAVIAAAAWAGSLLAGGARDGRT